MNNINYTEAVARVAKSIRGQKAASSDSERMTDTITVFVASEVLHMLFDNIPVNEIALDIAIYKENE